MKIWTTQTESVIEHIIKNNVYKPDFELSNGLGSNRMKGAYNSLLENYMYRNHIKCKGLVFGLSKLDDMPIKNIYQYREYFKKNPCFWDSVSSAGKNYATLELEISDEIDTIPIYFQDFIILGMRNIENYEFKDYVKAKLKNIKFQDFTSDLKIAQSITWTKDDILNKITQAHIHQISINDIKGVYETYDFSKNHEYSLGDNSLYLKKYINSNL